MPTPFCSCFFLPALKSCAAGREKYKGHSGEDYCHIDSIAFHMLMPKLGFELLDPGWLLCRLDLQLHGPSFRGYDHAGVEGKRCHERQQQYSPGRKKFFYERDGQKGGERKHPGHIA